MPQTKTCPEMTPPDFCRNNLFEKIVTVVMVATAAFVVLAVGCSAIMRYFVRRDIYGVEELITIAAFWMYFAGAVYATKTRQQISAEMFTVLTKNPKVLYVVALAQRSITLLLCLIYAWWGWEFIFWSVQSGGRTTLWQIPLYVGQSAVFLGLICMLIYFVRDLILILRIKPSDYYPGRA